MFNFLCSVVVTLFMAYIWYHQVFVPFFGENVLARCWAYCTDGVTLLVWGGFGLGFLLLHLLGRLVFGETWSGPDVRPPSTVDY